MKVIFVSASAQGIAPFADPKIELEQFPTGAHLASRLLFTVSDRACRCLRLSPPNFETLSRFSAQAVAVDTPSRALAPSPVQAALDGQCR